jgi:hypothetical protein
MSGWLVMSMGLKDAENKIQRVTRKTLQVYVRCTWLTSSQLLILFNEHVQHIKLVLAKLLEARLRAKVPKCQFAHTSIDFLRQLIESKRIRQCPGKVQVIHDWATPDSAKVKGYRIFSGAGGIFFRKLIRGLLHIK